MYTMLIGRPPFETSNVKTTYKRIKMNFYTFPDHVKISPEAKDLIQSLLKKEPSCRISLDKFLTHEFFKGPFPETLPSSALACAPSIDLCRTASTKTGSDESDKPILRPISSNRNISSGSRNILTSRNRVDQSRESRG